ncbi:MAG: cysteine-rich CWC family protein [Planctomycetes bacterium]|nr:cysteine-rich CWC family protein [Planctomycetota bacterium]
MDALCDARRCPLCGGPNACAMAAGSSTPCWCAAATIAPAALARVPEAARGRACLCRTCATGAPSSSAAPAARPSDAPPGP